MSIYIDKLTNNLMDSRNKDLKILDANAFSVCYTLEDDDITKGKKPPQTPYVDRRDPLIFKNDCWQGEKTKSKMSFYPFLDGLMFDLQSSNEGFSEFGVNLSLNFMGKKNLGGWKNQYLFNSVYMLPDKKFIYMYLKSPCGCNLLITVTSEADGWKMDYSPYSWGHYFLNLKLLASYDRAYKTGNKRSFISFGIFPVDDFDSCLEKLQKIYKVPFLAYDVNGGEFGKEINLKPFGKCDFIIEEWENEKRILPFSPVYKIEKEGMIALTPLYQGKEGAKCTLYGYKDIFSLYKKAMESVNLETIKNHTDSNLCEHQCWASATLRFLMKYKDRLTNEEISVFEARVKSLLDVITEENEEKAKERITILKKPHLNFPAFNVYKSCRVQELFFGITILLDAYKYFSLEKYKEYAVGATECLISHYQKENGMIEVDWGNAKEDYTTVCCPMIPLCDMANYFNGSTLGEKFKNACDKMAEYLYNRGLCFPTEGSKSSLAEEEMEDGSISCTALALLYYCQSIEQNERYLIKAKEILDIHESWVINSVICQMSRSSLRWWETQWEGDGDGPAICAAHSWSIWRGESDLLYYLLTGDKIYKKNAQNTFLTTLSKIDKNGKSYANYNPDEINGGGFSDNAENVLFRISPKFPVQEDCGMSRYPFIRLAEYI